MEHKKVKLDGPKLNVPNKNGRIYPDSPFKVALEKYQDKIDLGQAFGELGHSDSPNISVRNISHLVTSAKIKHFNLPRKLKKKLKKTNKWTMWKYENSRLVLGVEVLNVSKGKDLKPFINDCFVSMRSTGRVDEHNRVSELTILSFDIFPNA